MYRPQSVELVSVQAVLSFLTSFTSQTAAVVQMWRKEKFDKGFLTIEQKKAETKEVCTRKHSLHYISHYYDIIFN